jgi:nucleoid-associated protein YgaU
MTLLDMLGNDPLTASWMVALGLLFLLLVAVPIVRTMLAAALYAFALLTGRSHLRATAARVMPRIAHLLGGVVLGTAAVAAPGMAATTHHSAVAAIDLDRDAGTTKVPQVAVTPVHSDAAVSSFSLDRASAKPAISHAAEASDAPYIVRSGDTLWDIAASQLSQPTNAEITDAWKAIWQANRVTIGDEPGQIHPGQLLDLGALA